MYTNVPVCLCEAASSDMRVMDVLCAIIDGYKRKRAVHVNQAFGFHPLGDSIWEPLSALPDSQSAGDVLFMSCPSLYLPHWQTLSLSLLLPLCSSLFSHHISMSL